MTSMKCTMVFLLFFIAGLPAMGIGQEPLTADRVDLPEECVRLLVDSTNDPCAVCAGKSRAKAFRILNAVLKRGTIIKSKAPCLFTRSDGLGKNELRLSCHSTSPILLTFRVHTAEDHLVGIAPSDYTESQTADLISSAPRETFFEGSLEIIEYRYGDGPAYNYFPSMSHLQVHSRILELGKTKER